MKLSIYYYRFTAVAFLFFTLFSCNKVEQVAPDYEKLLVSSEWVYSEEVSLDIINAGVVNLVLGSTTLAFDTTGIVVSNLFTIDIENNWELNADKTSIIIDKGLSSEDEWIIVSLTETELIFKDFDDDDASGGALPFTYTDGKPLELKFTH